MTESGDDCRQTGLADELPNRYSPAACPQVEAAPQQRPNLVRLGWQQRAMLALLGGALFTLLAIAVVLQPDRSGFGTHRQLGMPRCTFLVIFGYRCPSCGMTTSWAHLVRGELTAAMVANAGGTLLAVLAMMAGLWSVVTAVRGRYLVGLPGRGAVVTVFVVVVLVTVVQWVWRLAMA